ncbi:MAG: 50S ribosomal protein L20 [Patescibacteria group bacterium]|nr:50S ribosomal protein L20 [Patescibacteria group bacterium]
MPRVKGGVHAAKKRRTVLKATKGYRNARSKKEREARTAMLKAGADAFAGRRDKKNDYRRLWNIKIGAAVRPLGLSYSRFIDLLAKKKIELDRKSLATLAKEEPAAFERLVKQVQA